MLFAEWLAQAPEDEKVVANEFRHHYPSTIQVLEIIGDAFGTKEYAQTVCGCDERYGYVFGSPGHDNETSEDVSILFQTLDQEATIDFEATQE